MATIKQTKQLELFEHSVFGIKTARIKKQDSGAAGLTTNDYLTND